DGIRDRNVTGVQTCALPICFLTKRKGWFGVKKNDIEDIGKNKEVEPTIFRRRVDIVKHRKKIFTLTISLIIIGIASLSFLQLNPGIDFTSGSRVEILSDETITTASIEDAMKELDLEAKSIVTSGENGEIAVVRYDSVLNKEKINEVKNYFMDKYGHEPSVSVVSPIVGQELVKNAVKALAIAAIGMIIYVTMRFEFYFSITAIAALLHDVFFMLVIFSIFQIEFDVT